MEGVIEKFKRTAIRFKEHTTKLQQQRRRIIQLGTNFEETLIKKNNNRIKITQKPNTTSTKTTPSHTKHRKIKTHKNNHDNVSPTTTTTRTSTTNITSQANIDLTTQTTAIAQENPPSGTWKYPQQNGYTIVAQDEERLEEGRFLNDTIINVVLKWIQNELVGSPWAPFVRIMDTMWYDSLARGYPHGGLECLQENMDRMKKWFPQGHPFDGKITVTPICLHHHWFIHVALEINGEWVTTTLNSLEGISTTRAEEVLEQAIAKYIPEKQIIKTSCKVPQQGNMVDCGLYALRNVVRFLYWTTNNPNGDWTDLEVFMNQGAEFMTRTALKELVAKLKSGTHTNTELTKLCSNKKEEEEQVPEQGKRENMEVDDTLLKEDLFLSSEDEEEERIKVAPGEDVVKQKITWTNWGKETWKISAKDQEEAREEVDRAKETLKIKKQVNIKRKMGKITIQYRIYKKHAKIIRR